MTNQQPKLRFKGFRGDWDKIKIGELAEIVRGSSPRPISDPRWFDNNSDIGWLRISDVTKQNGRITNLEQKISKEAENKTRVLYDKHLLLSIAATVGKPVINYVKTGVHDGFLIFINPLFEIEYMYQWLDAFRPKWKKYGQPGSQVNLNSELVKSQSIYIPQNKEQQKIGTFFKQLDATIELYQKQLSLVKEQKKGFLQNMFPKDGEKVPELRFKGFSGDWDEKKLGEVSEIIDGDRGKNYPSISDFSNKGHTLFLNASNVTKNGFSFGQNQYINEVKSDSMGKGKLEEGDIILTTRGSIGNIAWYDRNISTLFPFVRINSGMLILRTKNTESPNFISQYLKSPIGRKQINFISFGSAQPQLTKKDISLYLIKKPILKEQQKIGSFFKQLDENIELLENKLNDLNKLKKGFLQKMFV
ncbi:restriction endonuclease subunit S [Mammaliicoccus sciuri]|uniref:restriction endonuclease subunit S n=1 Tax=Mammaliicoccus sciuri TaxID=1296 RepID=UPI002DB74A4F|nr:restriction endonuclease subunit S [Mammaliicoccus sciuri]MEB7408374.1 restriction endonuclease subunit S [Mammaliicoccus sciuri]